MRLLIQRVKEASVRVEGEICGKIGQGILAFIGIHRDDKPEYITWLVDRLVNLRIFSDEAGKMNLSLKDIGGEILIVSQFTLYGNCTNGRRPDFISSASGPLALDLYQKFIEEATKVCGKVETGQFGAYMEVSLINDGPVTFILEHKDL